MPRGVRSLRYRWLDASRRQLSIAAGALFALGQAVVRLVMDRHDVWGAIVGPTVGGLVFGVFFGRFIHRQREASKATIEGLDATRRVEAYKAARRGPAPQDSAVRSAASAIVSHQIAEHRRTRSRSAVVFVLFGVLSLVEAVIFTPWFAAGAAVFAVLLVVLVLTPRRLARRAEMLR